MLALAHRVVELWAVLGGVLLLAVVAMVTWSMASGAVLGAPIPGDFEMVEVGVAVSAFAFLPYVQLTGANVTADLFTSGAGPRTQAMLALIAAVIAVLFSALLLWRMSAGLVSYREYLETTAILGFPIWIAFVPILVSLVLLTMACLVTLYEAARDTRRPAA